MLTQSFSRSNHVNVDRTMIIDVPSKTSNSAKMLKTEAAENLKLYLAAVESYRTGCLTPILKEELKYHIQSRRLSEGKDEMVVDFNQVHSRKEPLRPDEIERQEKRKEQNKKAATKFREKRKREEQKLKEELEKLTWRNEELTEEVKRLENEINTLKPMVFQVLQQSNIT